MASYDTAVALDDGPWNGMLDSIAPTSRVQGKYLLGQNIYPLDPAHGAGLVGRPGVRVLGAQLGGVGVRRSQGVYQFTKESGTEYTIAIVGGKFYTLNWTTEVWTEVLSAANLTTAVVTLSTTAQVAFLTFSDKVLISDGVNTPWMWDGTSGSGITKLTNAPVFYGQPTNYYARIFGIKASDPTTIVWSETDDPNTGYEAGGYNNAWSLTQTDPNRLYAILGTNESLYALRGRSGTTLGGVPSSSFASTATRDSLSDTGGTMSPFGVAIQDINLIMLDGDGHPQYLRPGGVGFTPLWTEIRETLKTLPKTAADLAKVMTVLYTPASLLLIAVPDEDSTECDLVLVYDVKGTTPTAVGLWRGWEMTSLQMVENALTGVPVLVHGDTTGRVYLHGNPEDATPWDDFMADGTVPIEHILELQALGYSTKKEKIYDRIDLALRALTIMTLEVKVITPRGNSATQILSASPGYLGWDTAYWDETTFDLDVSTTTQEAHVDAGIDEQARWVKPRVLHSTLGEQFGITAVTIAAYETDDDPEVP